MTDKHIDELFKDALQDIELPYHSDAWDAMQERMDGLQNDAQFDYSMKDQFEDFQVAYAPASWDKMAERMDTELNDEQFDDSLKTELSDIQATYRHKNWLQLKEWLDYRWFASNKVYISKAAEAVLMLLALFTFFNYNTGLVEPIQSTSLTATLLDDLPSQNETAISAMTYANQIEESIDKVVESNSTNATKSIEITDAIEANNSAITHQSKTNQTTEAAIDINEGLQGSSQQLNALDFVPNVFNEQPGIKARATAAPERSKSTDHKAMNAASDNSSDLLPAINKLGPVDTEFHEIEFQSDPLDVMDFNPLAPIETKKQKRSNKRALAQVSADDQQNGRLTDGINALRSSFVIPTDHLPLLAMDLISSNSEDGINPLLASNVIPTDHLPLLAMDFISSNSEDGFNQLLASNDLGVKFPVDKKWAISTFVDLDFNQISTPYDHLYQKNGYNQHRIGTGGGILVHRDLGPVEISTGVGYSSKQYNPKEFIELVKNTPEADGTAYRFKGIKLNVLTIPIHAAYYITKKGNWRPYIVGGAAAQLALQAQYEKESERVPRAVPVPQFLNENEGATVTYGQANFEKKKFPDGLLGDGSFKQNHYFTLDIGVGIERKLTPSTSFFVQPTVYYNLFNKGLSANNDKINTFSLQIGTKTRI